MKSSFYQLIAVALAAQKAHAYMAIEFHAIHNIVGASNIQRFRGYPQNFDDSPGDDVPDTWCEYTAGTSEMPWSCETGGYTGTVTGVTNGCNNQLAITGGTIATPNGEVVDVMTDSRCEHLCREEATNTFQYWRCEV